MSIIVLILVFFGMKDVIKENENSQIKTIDVLKEALTSMVKRPLILFAFIGFMSSYV